jgi:hypothetical protein
MLLFSSVSKSGTDVTLCTYDEPQWLVRWLVLARSDISTSMLSEDLTRTEPVAYYQLKPPFLGILVILRLRRLQMV